MVTTVEMIEGFLAFLVILIVSGLFTTVGIGAINLVIDPKKASNSLKFGMGFFLGMTCFISIWCFLESIIGKASFSLYLSLIIYASFAYYKNNYKNLSSSLTFFLKHKYKIISISLLYFVGSVIFRVPPTNFSIDTHLGSGSTMLYFNKVLFFYKEDMIPSLSVNIGQSLLGSIPLFFGLVKTGLFSLCTWTVINIYVLGVLVYGILRNINLSERKSLLGALFVLFGNTALSLFPVVVVDSGAPFISGNYAHSILTVGSSTSALMIIYFLMQGYGLSFRLAKILSFFVITSWVITGPQNIIVGVPALLIFSLWFMYKKQLRFRSFLLNGTLILVSLFLGMTQGGLISPSSFREVKIEKIIPGWQNSPQGVPMRFDNPGLDSSITIANSIFALQLPSGSRFHDRNRKYDAIIPYEFKGGFYSTFVENINENKFKSRFAQILLFETELWLAIRLWFVPIFGICLVILLSFTNIMSQIKDENRTFLKSLCVAATVLFTGGFLLSFIPYQVGIKWPFTRFFLTGYVPAQICFFLGLVTICNSAVLTKRFRNYMLVIPCFILMFGWSASFASNIVTNIFTYNTNKENILTRSLRMITTSDYVKYKE